MVAVLLIACWWETGSSSTTTPSPPSACALLKANDICTAEPDMTAQRLVDGGFTKRYDYALQTLTELPYASWREFDAEDLKLLRAARSTRWAWINWSPNAILAEGTDWRFLSELKHELKA